MDWIIKAIWVLFALLVVFIVVEVRAAYAAMPFDYVVVDGDTFKKKGTRVYYRIVGYDSPETYRPRCSEEVLRGEKATAFLKDLLAKPEIKLRHTGLNDRYGRKLVRVILGHTDIAGLFIQNQLGVYSDGRTRFDWCQHLKAKALD